MRIPVTQFRRPDGQQVEITTELSDGLWEQWDELVACGARMTAEVLTTGEVSLCVEHPVHGDFDIQVVANGPEVLRAVDKLVEGFSESAFNAWLTEDN